MKKIANITWITYPNFGTFLQAYALQQYIISLGYEDAILDDSHIIDTHIDWKYRVKKWIWSLDGTYRKYSNSLKTAQKLYDSFKREHILIESNSTDIHYLNETYDCFVCGSDQIWNPFSLSNPKSAFFYADFTPKKKIAYAPSIGVSSIPSEFEDRFRILIKGFSFLSAREKQGQYIMQKLSGQCVANVVDPTLLLNENQWSKLLVNNKIATGGKYVLGYFLTPNSIYIEAAKAYAHRYGYRFKMFYTDKTYSSVADELITAGPIEFLQAIHDAEYLFTDSFHGSIFASIFRVQFVTFKRFKNTITSQNSRVENLLKMMDVEERLLSEENVADIDKLKEIDFEQVWSQITPYITESKDYLIHALQ